MASRQKRLFLYLSCQEHADTWIHGGQVPLNPARNYLSEVREGTQTPDEIMQKRIVGAGIRDLEAGGIRITGTGTVGNLTITNSYVGGKFIPDAQYSQHPEEALILCLCTTHDAKIMKRLGHSVCIEIPNVWALRNHLDKQVGCRSTAKAVRYTNEPGNRTHFLKGTEDSWQREFRMVWSRSDLGTETRWVDVPSGLAVQS